MKSDYPRERTKMGEESFALIEKKITDLIQVVAALKRRRNPRGEVARKDGR